MSVDKEDRNSLKQSQQVLSEIHEEQLEGYNFLKTLGKGNFGKVQLGMHVLTGQYVAIKILEKDLIFEKADIQRISRQIKIMKLIRHPNIIQLYQIIEKPKRLYLIMEYAQGGDLFDLIVKNEKLSQKKAINYFAQIILGLQYLHSKGVAHRDMKPQNILISDDKIKIADFGLGNFFNEGEMLKTACGSPCYASPQMLQRVPYDPQAVDIWSSGIILYAMMCGYLPFQDQVTTKLYEKIKNNNPRFPKFLKQEVKSLMKRILDKNPQTRIKIQQIKQQPLVKADFQSSAIKQFDVDQKKLDKIYSIYGINDKQKLTSYLRKNKHNNLTTIYYLACRSKLQELNQGPEKRQNQEEHQKKDQSTGERQNQRDQKVLQIVQNLDNQQQQTKLNKIQDFKHTSSEIQYQVPKFQKIQQIQKENNNQFKDDLKNRQQNKVQQKASSNQKSNSIKNDISFSQLESFSSQQLPNIQQNIHQRNSDIVVMSNQYSYNEKKDDFKQNQKEQQSGNIKILNAIEQEQKSKQKTLQQKQNQQKQKNEQQMIKSKRNQEKQKQVDTPKKNTKNDLNLKSSQSNKNKNQQQKRTKQQNKNIQITEEEKKKKIVPLIKKQSSKQSIPSAKNSLNQSKTYLKSKKSLQQDKLNKSCNQFDSQKQINHKEHSKNSQITNGHKTNLSNSVKINPSNFTKKSQTNKVFEQKEKNQAKHQQKEEKNKNQPILDNSKVNIQPNESIRQMQKYFNKKPKLIKTGRMEVARPSPTDAYQKAPPLYERSHSRDKPMATKKIIGKPINSEPFLIDPSRIVLCSWQSLSSILAQRKAEGRVQYFSYGKACIYIAKSSIKGIHSLKDLIERINSGQLN